ncbi:type II toxin-antitoxin system PemK/MazF family toxin [Deinococcus antarcticus]|uniref:mRNA interferase n=1 Tax=Deinococcus antarcticus TaxID=1298767 RepID=A0ABV8AAQ0_9DEIO
MKRGEVWEATLLPRSGSEQQGTRPVILLMRENFLSAESWRSILVVPLTTSTAQGRRGPTSVLLSAGVGGLTRDSFALAHQYTTLDRSKITRKLGELPATELLAVEQAVILAAGITWALNPESVR